MLSHMMRSRGAANSLSNLLPCRKSSSMLDLAITPALLDLLQRGARDAGLPEASCVAARLAWRLPDPAAMPTPLDRSGMQLPATPRSPRCLQDVRAAAAAVAAAGTCGGVPWDLVKALAAHARQRDGDAAPTLQQASSWMLQLCALRRRPRLRGIT